MSTNTNLGLTGALEEKHRTPENSFHYFISYFSLTVISHKRQPFKDGPLPHIASWDLKSITVDEFAVRMPCGHLCNFFFFFVGCRSVFFFLNKSLRWKIKNTVVILLTGP